MKVKEKTKDLIISHKSALYLLRLYRTNSEAIKNIVGNSNLYKNIKIEQNSMVDKLVCQNKEKWADSQYKCHLAPKGFSKRSAIQISRNLYCVKPELLIIQLSTYLNFYNLFLLISELCGTYSISPIGEEFSREIKQATTIKKIIEYRDNLLCHSNLIRGNKLLNNVLRIAKNNSASPMESRLMLKLAGPRKYGCYGIQNLEFNKPIALSKAASLIAGQNNVIPDISNLEHKIAIEYDSAQFHENSEQGQKDKLRRDALVHDGWTVHSIVPSIMNNPSSFHEVAISILKELNQNSRIRNKDFTKNRNYVFSIL